MIFEHDLIMRALYLHASALKGKPSQTQTMFPSKVNYEPIPHTNLCSPFLTQRLIILSLHNTGEYNFHK